MARAARMPACTQPGKSRISKRNPRSARKNSSARFNALLPPSIRVNAAEEVGPDFHSRRDALAKTYRYRIFRGRVVPPFLWRYVHQDLGPLDFDAMAEAARHFIGEHDFTTFAASTGSEEDDRERTTVRTIFQSEWMRCQNANSYQTAEEWVYLVRGGLSCDTW